MKALSFLVLIFFIVIGNAIAQPKITAQQVGDKIEIINNGTLLSSYILSENEKYPFFFPVNSSLNASVTSMRKEKRVLLENYSAWIDYYSKRRKRVEGITIIRHPQTSDFHRRDLLAIMIFSRQHQCTVQKIKEPQN